MSKEEIKFYPAHPTDEKTHQLETQDCPILEQSAPIASGELYELFCNDFEHALEVYEDKRFEISGTAIRVGLDGHKKPSVQLSDSVEGRCHVLCVFPTEDVLHEVAVGDKVVIRGNYLVMCNLYGIVIKKCEVVLGE